MGYYWSGRETDLDRVGRECFLKKMTFETVSRESKLWQVFLGRERINN
jgi:hypothetical protein